MNMHGLPAWKKVIIRLAFLAMALGFIFQCWITTQVGEPYPALQMPGFRGCAGYKQGQVGLQRFEAGFICEDGAAVFSQMDLFKDLPGSYHSFIAEKFCKPANLEKKFNLPLGVWQGCWRRFFPGLHAAEMKRRDESNPESFRAWLEQRAEKLMPGRQVRKVELTWFEEMVSFHHEHNCTGNRRLLGRLTIPLASAALPE